MEMSMYEKGIQWKSTRSDSTVHQPQKTRKSIVQEVFNRECLNSQMLEPI